MKKIIVIGSGPAGISATKAILKKGYNVTMLDVGYELEIENLKFKKKLSNLNPDDWPSSDSEIFSNSIKISLKGEEKKNLYNSDFASKNNKFFNFEMKNCNPYLSFSKGGLSNLWGRGVETYNAEELTNWPSKINNFKDYYRKINEFVKISINNDFKNNESIFKYSKNTYNLSEQSKYLLDKYYQNSKTLNKKGINIKSTNIAGNFNNCKYCGYCLYGCVYDILYTTNHSLEELKLDKRFEYKGGITVQTITENKDTKVLKIKAIKNSNGEMIIFNASKVYLAAGAISSTRIIMESKKIYNKNISIKTSDLFYIPCITLKNIKNIETEKLFTLSQINYKIKDYSISKTPINLYVHGFSLLFKKVFHKKNLFNFFLSKILNLFLGRIIILFDFIHSDESSFINLNLQRDKLILEGINNQQSSIINNKIKTKLLKNFFKTGIIPFLFFNAKRPIGGSSHLGSSFPMNDNPKDFESDIYGRVLDYKNLHVVDASILPDIPSISHTYTIMANSYRIAEESVDDNIN